MVVKVFNSKLRIKLRKTNQKQTYNLTLVMSMEEQVHTEVIVSQLISLAAPLKDNKFILTMVSSCQN
jgi:hypothetical protein